MAVFNLNSLLHREYTWTETLRDGSVHSGVDIRKIPVRIPRIQRDYAEGRESEKIERKRYSLINDMLDVVYGQRDGLQFDFIYGYMMNNGIVVTDESWQDCKSCQNPFFEPLDGQQRLTTLFLLYWLFGRGADLQDDNGHSLFVYETRDTSEEFCHWLVKQDARGIIEGWQKLANEAKEQNTANEAKWKTERTNGKVDPIVNRLRFPLIPVPSLFDIMKTSEEFKWDWHDDPNIRSMIRVIEATYRYATERSLSYQDGIANSANLDKIVFMLLDNLDCDGDQLFEKMNARGKALTSFEILKSSLEEEMEQQGLPASAQPFTNDWRKAIDGDWIDFCWDRANIGPDPKLDDVRKVEEILEKLLIRLTAKSFYATAIAGSTPNGVDAKNYRDIFAGSIFDGELVQIDRYLEFAKYERAVGNASFSKIGFQDIYDDIQNLIYKDPVDNRWKDASMLLPQLNRDNDSTLLDEFMDRPTHNIRVMMHAMLAYLKIAPAKAVAADNVERTNFVDWMRFIRNVYNANNKTSGLDNTDDVKDAIAAIDGWIKEYKANFRKNAPQDILLLIRDHIKANPKGQEQARLDEEHIKANLRISGTNGATAKDWEQSILEAEDNYYLWGQIIAPLSWSYDNNANDYDKSLFDKYAERLKMMFDGTAHDNDIIDSLLIQTMLCYADYRLNLRNGLGSLARFDNNRDYSWKRYLRDRNPGSNLYGELFKRVIDQWLQNPMVKLEDLLRQEIAIHKPKFALADWQYYLVNVSATSHGLLNLFWHIRTNGRYLYTAPSGHAYLFRSNTIKTANRYELLTTYLFFEESLRMPQVASARLAHTADEAGAHVDFTITTGDTIRISSIPDNPDAGILNMYSIEQKAANSDQWISLAQNIYASQVETQLQALGAIKSL